MPNLFQDLENLRVNSSLAYEAFISECQVVSVARGDSLVRTGAVNPKLFILETGLLRHFRIDQGGNEISTWFSREGDAVVAMESFVQQRPSVEGIVALEDATLLSMSRLNFQRLSASHHAIETFYRQQLERYYIEIERRLYRIQSFTAVEKYAFMLTESPDLLQRVPQKHLASYLGIRKETLSRIKRSFAAK